MSAVFWWFEVFVNYLLLWCSKQWLYLRGKRSGSKMVAVVVAMVVVAMVVVAMAVVGCGGEGMAAWSGCETLWHFGPSIHTATAGEMLHPRSGAFKMGKRAWIGNLAGS